MVFLTGDTHGDFRRVKQFCFKVKPTLDDTMIVLGDAALNYFGDTRDDKTKKYVSQFPITVFCIHGNHERRPHTIRTYKEKTYHGGTVWYEEEYPNILFTKDGEIYDFDGKKCIVIGGAYSVDKFYRLTMGWHWFSDEQPSDEIKRYVEKQLASVGNKVDVVLSHTCPVRYEPTEVFMSCIDQSKVDKSTEIWLGEIESKITYDKWYCGHYHTAKKIDKIQFMFDDYDTL